MIEAFNAFMDTFLDLGRLGGVAIIFGWLLVHPKDKLVWLLVIGFLVMGLASGYVAFQTVADVQSGLDQKSQSKGSS